MMLQELQTLERLNGLFLGSNANTHRPLMMFQELQTLKRFNGVLLGSNAQKHRAASGVPRVADSKEAQWGTPRL
jgi:hypothetical protein